MDEVKELKRFEAEQVKRLGKAKTDAEARIRKLEGEKAERIQKAVDDAEKKKAALIERARAEADAEAKEHLRDAEKDAVKTRAAAEKKIDDAAEAIIKML